MQAQTSLTGRVQNANGHPIAEALVHIQNSSFRTSTCIDGTFEITLTTETEVAVLVEAYGYGDFIKTVDLKSTSHIQVELEKEKQELNEIVLNEKKENNFGRTTLSSVEGTAIYAGKKSEVVLLEDIQANLATNNSRQIYAKVAGLNIWENDGAGIQLGIGGRGLNPNRVSNFNTRQNGYDISADALGYPES